MTASHSTRAADQELSRSGRWIALAVLVLAVLLVAVDATVLGLATPFLSEDLRPTGTQLLWIGDVYSFVIAGLLVSMGSLGDRIGRKKMLLTGATAFGLVSVLNAYATSPELMIVARALLGVAGATLMPSTLALIRNIFHDARERSVAIGIWGAAASAGAAVGPVVGGFLLEHFWWGSVFLINLPVMAVLVIVGLKLLPESKNPAPGPWDLPSVGLSLVGIIAVVYAIKEGAVHGASWDVGAAALLGLAALAWFVRRQLTLTSPLLDMHLFRNRGFSAAVLADLLTILGLAGLVFFLSQYLQLVQGRRPLEAGLAELPAAVGAVVAGLLAGRAARRFSVRAVVSGGLASIGLALGAITLVGQDTAYPLLGAILLVVGVGAGLAFTVTADVILSTVPKEQAGAASAVSETAYELGAALGIALLGSIVTGVYRGFATPAGTPGPVADAAHESLGGAVEAASELPARTGAELVAAAQRAFVDGLHTASSVGALVLVATAVAAWFLLRGQRLEGGAATAHP
ncbi:MULTISPECIES: MFS transporter [Streptomyces]|uniref:MFS transporter n=3 Tax=Streptomyces TaxID=1883 RepID=A0A8H9LQP3_9ACTN|nr:MULTISPECIES: MFS transporter [Streptomyces]MDQ0296773.1 DHA2 family multidrug resistance protein-like MFS transporter [Streptomyces sp. DSM 41037]NEC11883.1 MFS transporter [Streptomyces sp. SID8014]QNE80355.1 MFS transporter [Streptomyces rutgersensis]RPK80845.1 Antiseptic resistance protein [Streptomyces sp. ADI98-12]WPR50373.1 MFS transporter [Streptomyces sp. S399]